MGVRATEPGVGARQGCTTSHRWCKEAFIKSSGVPTRPAQSTGTSQRNPSFSSSVQPQSGKPRPRDKPSGTGCAPSPDALCTAPFSSFTDDTVTSSTSESSALSKKRFTLQGFANLKGQKGKRRPPKIISWTGPSPWWHVSHPFV